MGGLGYKTLRDIFSTPISRHAILKAEKEGRIPASAREQRGSIAARIWELSDVPAIGEKYGFLGKLKEPQVWTVFATKGGVYKTTLAFNIARVAALHNIRVCVVGLDLQCDISRLLGATPDDEQITDLEQALELYDKQPNLASLLDERYSVTDLARTCGDLPNLSVIPESLGLIHLEMSLNARMRKEMWLKERVTEPLKKEFDLIIIDCPPSWSTTIANALVATDVLISPLEVGMSHFQNVRSFISFLDAFRKEMKISFEHLFIPTRYNSRRRLSQDICDWYLKNIQNCTRGVIRDSAAGYDAGSQNKSIIEFAPRSDAAIEMRSLLQEIWTRLGLEEKSSLRRTA